MDTKRLVWADTLRGLLIVLVVVGHSLQFGDYENRMSWNIIYSFHMATFFMISGYVGHKDNYQIFSLKHKAQQLLIPFFTWSVLAILIKGENWQYLYEIILKPDSSYWFIFVLFFIIALFVLINCAFVNKKSICKSIYCSDFVLLFTILGLVLIMVVSEFRLFGFQFYALYFGFYVYGYWLRKFHIKFKVSWIIYLGITWLVLALFWRMHEMPLPLQNISFIPHSLLIYSYRYITAFIGSLFFVGFAMKFLNKENIVIKCLSYLGKISLGIYIIHLFIGRYVSNIFESFFNSNVSIPFVFCDFVTKLIISIVLINIIQKIPYLRLLLLGKK